MPSTCVSITGAATSPKVGRTPMFVMAGRITPSIRDRRRVDAVRRHELVVGLRDSPSGTRASVPRRAPRDDRAVDRVRMAEQRAGLVHAALANQPPDARAADDELLVAHRVDLLGAEAVARAERSQQREVARALAAEEEVRADPDLGHVQPVDEHRAHERLRIPLRQLVREADDGRALDAGVRRSPRAAAPWSSGAAAPCRAARRAAGCGSNVMTTDVAPRSLARRLTRSMILMCPRCRPSKLPSASTGCTQRGGSGSSGKWMTSTRDEPAPAGPQSANSQRQPIICQFHARRQAGAGRGMRQIVRDVREQSTRGAQALHGGERLVDGRNASGAAARAARRARAGPTPSSSGHDPSGMALQSVRYAKPPTR